MGHCGSKSSTTKSQRQPTGTTTTTTATTIGSTDSTTNNNGSFPAVHPLKRSLSQLFPEFRGKTPQDPEWEHESSTGVCPECHQSYDVFNRSHHCRSCGKLYCKTCCYSRKSLKDEKICGMCMHMATVRLQRRELSHRDSKLKRNSELIRRNLAAKKEEEEQQKKRASSRSVSPQRGAEQHDGNGRESPSPQQNRNGADEVVEEAHEEGVQPPPPSPPESQQQQEQQQ